MSSKNVSTAINVDDIATRAAAVGFHSPHDRRRLMASIRAGKRRKKGLAARRWVMIDQFAEEVEEQTGRQVTSTFYLMIEEAFRRGLQKPNDAQLRLCAAELVDSIERVETRMRVAAEETRARLGVGTPSVRAIAAELNLLTAMITEDRYIEAEGVVSALCDAPKGDDTKDLSAALSALAADLKRRKGTTALYMIDLMDRAYCGGLAARAKLRLVLGGASS